MKRKFNHKSTQRKTASSIKALNTKKEKITTYTYVSILVHVLAWDRSKYNICDGVKPLDGYQPPLNNWISNDKIDIS
jgi:hypothetical protein